MLESISGKKEKNETDVAAMDKIKKFDVAD